MDREATLTRRPQRRHRPPRRALLSMGESARARCPVLDIVCVNVAVGATLNVVVHVITASMRTTSAQSRSPFQPAERSSPPPPSGVACVPLAYALLQPLPHEVPARLLDTVPHSRTRGRRPRLAPIERSDAFASESSRRTDSLSSSRPCFNVGDRDWKRRRWTIREWSEPTRAQTASRTRLRAVVARTSRRDTLKAPGGRSGLIGGARHPGTVGRKRCRPP